MKRYRTQHHIDGLLALLLFSVFAVCILLVLLTGADAYKRLTRRDSAAYNDRTCIQYLTTRVRQAPVGSALQVTELAGSDSLLFTEDYEDQDTGEEVSYVTAIYCYEGWLRELFMEAETFYSGAFDPESGEKIIEVQDMTASQTESGLLRLCVTAEDGSEQSVCLMPRGGEETAS